MDTDHDNQPGDARTADLLRRALHTEADRTDVRPDGLTSIRGKIDARRRRRMPAVLLGAAAATVAASLVGVVGCLPPAPQPGPPSGAASAGPAPPGPAPTSGPTDRPTDRDGPVAGPATGGPPTAGAAGQQAGTPVATLPVYYVDAADGGGLRLYREFHRFQLTDTGVVAELRAALGEMLTAARLADPDYHTLWPAGSAVATVWTQYDIVGVNITGAGVANLDAAGAAAAVQQLAWTVAGVTGGDPRIRLLLDGEPVDRLWGHIDTGDEITKGAALDTLAMLWLIDPQHGDTVGSTFTVHLAGSVHEATAQLRIRQGGRVVHRQYVTLDAGAPGRGEAFVELSLPPGDYIIEAYEESMVADEAPRHLVDAAITVR